MESIITLMSRLYPWQLFLIVIGPMALAIVLFSPIVEPTLGPGGMDEILSQITRMMLVSLPGMVALYGWVLTIGVVCNRSLEPQYRKSDRLLRIAVPFATVYLAIASWAFPQVMMSHEPSTAQVVMAIIHTVATLGIFYGLIFAARSVAKLKDPENIGFVRPFGYFLGITYFFIGIWIIQPKINVLADAERVRGL